MKEPKKIGISDKCNRHINYLRISVTDRCNLKCIYCRPEGKIDKLTHGEILRYEEILKIINILAEKGLSKIRITGGEPLIRKGVFGFLKKVTRTPGIQDVSLTTNGVLLKKHIRNIYDSGVRRLNISLDSLEREKYKAITGLDLFDQVWDGIMAAHDRGFFPIKINIVALRGINDDEVTAFAGLARKFPFHIRFIEQMPIGNTTLGAENPLLAPEIKSILSSMGELAPISHAFLDGPAKRYRLSGAVGEVGIISPISHHFCSTCNRLRLTANGMLRPCLLSDYHEDLKAPLRSGASADELTEIIIRTIKNKPSRHTIAENTAIPVCSQMSSIGG